jgi:hypothetical protein
LTERGFRLRAPMAIPPWMVGLNVRPPLVTSRKPDLLGPETVYRPTGSPDSQASVTVTVIVWSAVRPDAVDVARTVTI